MKEYSKRIKQIDIFIFFSLMGIILFFIVGPFVGQKIVDWVVMENNPFYGTLDFFKCIPYSQHLSQIYFYGDDQFYPPLSYLPFYYLLRLTTNGNITDIARDIPFEDYQIWFYVMYNILGVLWMVNLINNFRIKKKKRILLAIALICSVPMFAGVIERGNPTFYVMLLLLNALLWKDSDIPWKREVSLIMIAIAAGLKVYPAIFGLFYVKEHRWRESGKLILYGVLFFFVPFIWFGGIDGIKQYVHLIGELSQNDTGARCEFFKGLLNFAGIEGLAANVLNYIFAFLLVMGMFVSKDQFCAFSYFSFFMAFVPTNAFRYTLIYLIIPLYYLFDENRKNNCKDVIVTFILGNIFTIPTVMGILTDFKLNFGIYSYTYVERYIYTFAWILLLVIIASDIWPMVIRNRTNNERG